MQGYRRLWKRIETLVLCLAGVAGWTVLPAGAQSHHFVYVSSATAHSISGFEVSQSSHSVTPIAGSPFDTGHDPGVLAFHPTGRFLYALNSDEDSVSAFSVHPVSGALTELNGSPVAVGSGTTPKFIAVEDSGKFFYVVGTLTDLQSTFTLVSHYSIDATGSVNPAVVDKTSPVILSPVALLSKLGDRFLYVVGNTTADQVAILTLELDAASGIPAAAPDLWPVSGQDATSAALAPSGESLFVAQGQAQRLINSYVLTDDGAFSQPQATFPVPDAAAPPVALATDHSGEHLYAAVTNLGLIGFSVDSASGVLTALPGAAFVDSPISPSAVMITDPEMQFPILYYEGRAFEIMTASGELNELDGSPMAVPGSVTGIAAASPADQLPGDDPINPISAPEISLSHSSLQFPALPVGSASAPQLVVLANTGNAPLLVSGISVTGVHASDFGLMHECVLIGPDEGCELTVTFEPEFEGAREASLVIMDNVPGSPHTVALAGTAQRPFSFQIGTLANTIAAGQTAQYELRLVPVGGFQGTVSLECAGAPREASCEVPASIEVNGAAPVLFSVKVSTKARPGFVLPIRVADRMDRNYVLMGPSALLLLLWLVYFRRISVLRGVRNHAAGASLLFCVSLALASCSGSGGLSPAGSATATAPAPTPATGTPAGQYSLTITANFRTVSESVELSLSVN